MKCVTLLWLNLSLLVSTGFAQEQMDNPVKVPVTYYAESMANNPYFCTFSLSGSGLVTSTGTVSNPTPGVPIYSTQQTSWITPNKTYEVTASGSGVAFIVARFPKMPGYDVFINGFPYTSYSQGINYTFDLRVVPTNDVTDQLAETRAGDCSSFPEDKAMWFISLGKARNGKFVGAIGFRAAKISTASPELWKTSALTYTSPDTTEVDVVRVSGHIKQILSREVLVHVDDYSGTATEYDIEIYPRSSVGSKSGGLWQKSGSPFITYTVKKSGTNGLLIIKKESETGSDLYWATKLVESGSTTWTLYDWRESNSSGIMTNNDERVVSVINGLTTNVYWGGSNATTSPVVEQEKTYVNHSWGRELESLTWGPDESHAPEFQYAYHTSTSDGGWPKAIKYVIKPSGEWTRYKYFNSGGNSKAGQIKTIFRPWESDVTDPDNATTSNCYVEEYEYTANFDGATTALSSKTTSIKGTQVGKTTWSYNFSLTPQVNGHTLAQTTQNDYSSSGSYLTTITKSYRQDNSNYYFQGKPHSVAYPDGRKLSYAYYNGTWDDSTRTFTAGASGDSRLVIEFDGQASGGTNVTSWTKGSLSWEIEPLHMVANLSTFTETVTDENGRVVSERRHVFTSANTENEISEVVYEYDSHGRLIETIDMNRSIQGLGLSKYLSKSEYSGSLMTSSTDFEGTTTTYDHNSLLRNTEIVRGYGGTYSEYPAVTETREYNKAGRLTRSYLSATGAGDTTYTYDEAGRELSRSEPGPHGADLTTSTTYNSDRVTTTTRPDGSTLIQEVFYDGRTKSLTGTGRAPVYFEYEYNSTGTVVLRKNGSTKANGWTETQSDWLGRVVKRTQPAPGWDESSDPNRVVDEESEYNSSGQLWRKRTKDRYNGSYTTADTILVYDAGGRLFRKGLDINNSGSLTEGSNDRITDFETSYEFSAGGWWKVNETYGYNTLNDSSATLLSENSERLTYFNGGSMHAHGFAVSEIKEVDQRGAETITTAVVNLSGKYRYTFINDESSSTDSIVVRRNGYFYGEQWQSGNYEIHEYDAYGRLEYIKGRYVSTSPQDIITYEYNTNNYSSQPNVISDNGLDTTYTYSWSATASNPRQVVVEDPEGNKTYTIYNRMGDPWKIWGDAAKPMEYGYDSQGRRTTMKTWKTSAFSFTGTSWPNPTGGSTTTWDYEEATGLLVEKIFPDSTGIDYTYNVLGQLKTRVWGRSPAVTTTYDYFDSSVATSHASHRSYELKKISYTGDGGVTSDVDYTYNRNGSIDEVTDATGTREFAYGTDSQISSETLPSFFGSRVLTYTYEDGSGSTQPGRFSGFNLKLSSTTEVDAIYQYDSSTGRLDSIEATYGPVAKFEFDYEDGIDWVETVTRTTANTYVRTNELHPNRTVVDRVQTKWSTTTRGDYDSSFNTRGFRSQMSRSGTSAITSDTRIFSYEETGELDGDTKSGGGGSYLTAEYDLIGNRDSITMHSGSTDYAATHATNRYTAITGNLAESNLTHDADGNMTRDGTWYYRYDAENRVYEMEKVNGTQTLQFVYDYLGRRVRKTVRSGGPGASVSSSTKFVWRGWELIAELNAGTGQTGYALLTTYLWGPDFAGHFGSSGGPAGLLAVRQNSNTYFPVYDAMGNVVSYLNSGGTDTARYEYLATGFITGQNGSYGDFDFGFSTQYTDRESGLVYFGKRFYSPKHGRFIHRDPIGEAGGNNLYAHTGNNPANASDYLGMQRTIWDGPGEGGETPSWPSVGALAGINPLLFSNYISPQWPGPIFIAGSPNKPFYDAVNRDQSWQLQSRAAGIGAGSRANGDKNSVTEIRKQIVRLKIREFRLRRNIRTAIREISDFNDSFDEVGDAIAGEIVILTTANVILVANSAVLEPIRASATARGYSGFIVVEKGGENGLIPISREVIENGAERVGREAFRKGIKSEGIANASQAFLAQLFIILSPSGQQEMAYELIELDVVIHSQSIQDLRSLQRRYNREIESLERQISRE